MQDLQTWQASIERTLRLLENQIHDLALREIVNKANLEQLTTASTTPTAPTQDSQWDAAGFPTPPTPTQSQSAPAEMQSGRVERSWKCVHEPFILGYRSTSESTPWTMDLTLECRKCHAFMHYAPIAVPDAEKDSSTSQSEPLKKPVVH